MYMAYSQMINPFKNIPCCEEYSQSEDWKAIAYSAVCDSIQWQFLGDIN